LREERRLRAFDSRVLRRILGPKRDELTREWRKLHNEELNVLYSSPIIVRAGHVARVVDTCRFWWGNLREREHWEDPGIDVRIVLK
jgi:hypothetical protein